MIRKLRKTNKLADDLALLPASVKKRLREAWVKGEPDEKVAMSYEPWTNVDERTPEQKLADLIRMQEDTAQTMLRELINLQREIDALKAKIAKRKGSTN